MAAPHHVAGAVSVGAWACCVTRRRWRFLLPGSTVLKARDARGTRKEAHWERILG